MTPRRELPPRWIGAALVTAGACGLIVMVYPRAAELFAILGFFLAACWLLGAAFATVSDDLPEYHYDEERAGRYADELNKQLKEWEAENAASQVIGDDHK